VQNGYSITLNLQLIAKKGPGSVHSGYLAQFKKVVAPWTWRLRHGKARHSEGHSNTLPIVSCSPHAFVFFFPTGWVLSPELPSYHAIASSEAGMASVLPARAAYSHSASVGSRWVGPNEYYVVPQWQKSKGWLILTAALELSSNQVTHFYSRKKNTEEMIRMAGLLRSQYADRRRIYPSWDAASWHA
jgi:hypothetical protein